MNGATDNHNGFDRIFVTPARRKFMKVSLATSLSLAVLLSAGIAAMAQGPEPGMGPGSGGPGFGMHRPPMEEALGLRGAHGRWWNDPALIEKLKLTDEQRKAMDEILLNHREKLIDMRAAVDKAELEMEPLIGDDQPNEARILAQIDKIAQARAELEKANARFLLAIRGKLSPDQWKGLKAARADRMQRRGWQGGQRERSPGRNDGPPPPQAGPGGGPQGMLNEMSHPSDEDLSPGTPVSHPSDEDLSLGTPVSHPSDEDLSPGTPVSAPDDPGSNPGLGDH
jgi:Spy/CpxP family protein refolding chaperone